MHSAADLNVHPENKYSRYLKELEYKFRKTGHTATTTVKTVLELEVWSIDKQG